MQLFSTYTYSHALGDPGAYGFEFEESSAQNPNCRYCDYSNSVYDEPQMFTFSGIYDLPFGKGMRFGSHTNPVLNGFLGNWEITSIIVAHSGYFQGVSIPDDIANIGPLNIAERPNYVAGQPVRETPAPGNATVGYLNPNAFSTPAEYTFGNLGLNTVPTPMNWDWDAGVYKNFPIHEGKQSFQFRAEFFDLPNTHQMGCFNGGLTTPGFGDSSCATGPRTIQFGLKFYY